MTTQILLPQQYGVFREGLVGAKTNCKIQLEVCNCKRSYSNYKIVGPTVKYITSICKPNNYVNIVATTIADFFQCMYH